MHTRPMVCRVQRARQGLLAMACVLAAVGAAQVMIQEAQAMGVPVLYQEMWRRAACHARATGYA